VAFAFSPKRLIKLNETHTEWLTEQQVLGLLEECGSRKGPGFMDITDHLYMEDSPAPLSTPPPVGCTRYLGRVRSLISTLDIENWKTKLDQFSNDETNIFTRYYTTASAEYGAVWLRDQYQSYIDASGRDDVSVRLFIHPPVGGWRQPSVIATFRGSFTDERVIVGGHIDSVGSSIAPTTTRSPGADDDGSGSISALEIFRNLVMNNFRPRYTVDFMGYAAEEVGLRGSQAIVEDYRARGIQVRGALQLDMTGYLPTPMSPPVIITDFTDPALTTFVRQCAIEYVSVVNWAPGTCGYACSDHASWTRGGYASAFVFECPFSQSNPNIHTPRDTLDRLSLPHALHFLKIGTAFVVEMAEEDI
jgi:leucyl aminopeptidase